jgi:hypothetical protein
MSAERQAAIRELMRAAERVLDICGNAALGDDPRLASRILMFTTAREGARTRLVVDLAAPLPTISGEMVRDVDSSEGIVRMERIELFALHAAPPDVTEPLH